MTIVHHSIPFVEIQSPINDGVIESVIIDASIAGLQIKVANIYVPPVSSSPPNYAASISPLLDLGAIVVGDVNAHNDEWSSGASDGRGDALADEIERVSPLR